MRKGWKPGLLLKTMARCKRSEKERELARDFSDESATVVLTRRWRLLLPLLHLLLWLLFDTAALVSFLLCWWFSFAPYIRWRSLRSCPFCGLLNSLGGQVSGVGRYLSRSEIFRGISCEELSREGFFCVFPPAPPLVSMWLRAWTKKRTGLLVF